MACALSVRNLQKCYGSRGVVTRALDGVTFDVERGEYVAIMGASGSGKSTLLNCIATIDRPTAGQILLDGQDVTELRQRDLARFRRERLGFIFQDANLLDTLTGGENVALALTINRSDPRTVDGRVREACARLGVTEVLDRYPRQMSGGQRQRVAAARALVTDPALVLADEPTGALDSRNARLLLETFQRINAEGATILMVTHDSFAASYAGRVLFIKDGRVFNELRRGDRARADFFHEVIDVVSFMGGEAADVR